MQIWCRISGRFILLYLLFIQLMLTIYFHHYLNIKSVIFSSEIPPT